MEKDRKNKVISIASLEKLQSLFQKDRQALIAIYLEEAERRVRALYHALDHHNTAKLIHHAQELRHRSQDIGAIQFSHACLGVEIAAQEYRFNVLHEYLAFLENQFTITREHLEAIVCTPA